MPRKSSVPQWLLDNRYRFSSRSKLIDGACETLRKARSTVNEHLINLENKGLISVERKSTTSTKPAKSTKSLASLQEKFDHTTRARNAIRRGVKTLSDLEGLSDAEFRNERCDGVPATGFRQVANEEEFFEYQFRIKDGVYWSSPVGKQWSLKNISVARDLNS